MNLDQAIERVSELALGCANLRSDLSDPWTNYLGWVDNCERQGRSLFADPALIAGLHTDRYWHMWQPGVHWAKLIAAEIDVQVERLGAIADRLRSYRLLRARAGRLAVVDTNVLLHYQRMDMIDWFDVVSVRPVRVVVPHVVLDELDDKRYSGDNIKRRARSAVVPFEEMRPALESEGFARLPVGEATVEFLVDEPNHQRQDSPDEEIVDRARFLQAIGCDVVLVTADLGMRARAVVRRVPVVEMPSKFARDQEGE